MVLRGNACYVSARGFLERYVVCDNCKPQDTCKSPASMLDSLKLR